MTDEKEKKSTKVHVIKDFGIMFYITVITSVTLVGFMIISYFRF